MDFVLTEKIEDKIVDAINWYIIHYELATEDIDDIQCVEKRDCTYSWEYLDNCVAVLVSCKSTGRICLKSGKYRRQTVDLLFRVTLGVIDGEFEILDDISLEDME